MFQMISARVSGSWCYAWQHRICVDTRCHRSCPARSWAHYHGNQSHHKWPPHSDGISPVTPPDASAANANRHHSGEWTVNGKLYELVGRHRQRLRLQLTRSISFRLLSTVCTRNSSNTFSSTALSACERCCALGPVSCSTTVWQRNWRPCS